MSESHHLTIGRFAPVHAGHAMMINKVLDAAKHDNATHTILTTASHDGNKNPLAPEQKVKHLKRAFPSANIEAMSKGAPTILHHLSKLHSQGVKNIVVHAGSDRAHEYHTLIHKYNGVESRHGHYNFDSIKVKTVGGTRTDADKGVAGASATKMRKAASSGDEKTFHSMAPSSMSKTHKHDMYKDVRRGLGIQESLSFKQFLVLELAAIPITAKPNRFHGNYGGKGNRGGEPVDKLDKEFQKHDVGYHHSKKPEDKIKHDKSLVKSTRKLVSDKSLPLKTRVKAGMAHALFRTKVALHSPKKK